MRNRPQPLHLPIRFIPMPGSQSRPNIARTTMKTRKSVTTLITLSEPVAGVERALLGRGGGLGQQVRPEAA